MNGVRVQSSPVSLWSGGRGVPVSSYDLDRAGEAGQLHGPCGVGGDALGQPLQAHRRDQHVGALGGVAQPGGHVHGRADVVVALEQQRVAGGDPGPQRQRGAHVGGPRFEIHREAMQSVWSTATIMQPSPSHLAMRTPRSDATSRAIVRKAPSSRPAASSPNAAV